MAVTLTGTGGLFTRAGKLIGAIRAINGVRASTAAVGVTDDASATWGASGAKVKEINTICTDIWAQYASTNQQLLDGLGSQRDSFRSAVSSFISYASQLASSTVIKMVDDDATLPSRDIRTAMTELVRQMANTSDSVKANTVSASVAAVSTNTGDAAAICSVLDGKGKTLEYAFPEVLELVVTNDSQSGGTAGQEPLTLSGEVALSDTLDWQWPDGSGARASLTMVDPTLDETGGNLLVNSGFDAFTANVPDDWHVVLGTAGTTVLKQVTTTYDSSGAALEFVGDGGGTLSSVKQVLGTDTSGTLKPNTVYGVCARVQKGSGAAAGAVQFALTDGDGAVITDDNSANNTITLAVGAMSSWTTMSGFFRTPKVLPATINFRVSVSTAITDTKSIYIDHLAMCEATQAYTGGPFVAIFAGATDVIKNDQWNITISNNNGGVIQTFFERMFGMRNLGLVLPSVTDDSETVAETLVS